MPKAILSNRIYLETTPELLTEISKALTYKIKKKMPGKAIFGQFDIVKNYKVLPKGVMSIPIGREDLIPEGYEIIDKRIRHELPFPDPKLPLNSEQLKIYDQVEGSCFINALVGWGKTYTALHLASKLGQKTLVVCHNTMLRDQWVKEVQQLYNMPVGIIGSGILDIDHSIVVGNIQSLTKLTPTLGKEFGTVIVDECLDYNTQVITKEKGKVRIGSLVNNRMPVHVLSLNPETGVSSFKKVLNYYKHPHTDCLQIHHSGGGNFKCTANHGVFVYVDGTITKVPAEYLEPGDLLLQTTSTHKATSILNPEWKSIASVPLLNEHYCVRKVTSINKSTLTGNNRFNIEVADNHTYFAAGILVANCHHVTANTFSTFLDGMYALNKIGLSGTMIRTDGRHVLFKDFFGPKLFQPPQSNTLVPTIQIVKTGIRLADGEGWAKKMNILQYDLDYQKFIASVAQLQIAKGHKVLVIADRVEFLQNVGELIGDSCVCITGGTSFEEREALKHQIESGEKSCIAGSRQIFSEGISVNPLSCVILAAPIANPGLLEQIIGRIQRQYPGKLMPLAIDMHFAGQADRAQNKIRLAFYMQKGWEVLGI